ncbi:DNA replication licensing factor REC [Drosophila sulfurigaster albostrigata]|uniref:DNA replication licensing factor REC n=1 Tax=Drosophila sulfurigaster albostrigata TaxID=89887 RepID=UPI002D21AA96|nr:DNA replication licensing factor REC [Drosophila sulfurigaster albostrigata]
MNPPRGGRAPSRFVRGRGRGGGAYRPYFYFRRNGRVIPAAQRGGREPDQGAAPSAATARPRGWNNPRGKRVSNTPLDCSFLRPEYYVAPEDGAQVRSLLVDNPRAYPGWRLYFPREDYVPQSELAARIIAVEAFFQRNPDDYTVKKIRKCGWIIFPASCHESDEQLKLAWPTMLEDMRNKPLRTLSIIGLAIHTVLVNDSLDAAEEAKTAAQPVLTTIRKFVPPNEYTSKLYVRPQDFAPVELMSSIVHSRVDTLFVVRGIVSSVGEPSYHLAWHAFRCTRCQTEQTLRQLGNYAPRPYHCLKPQCTAKDNFLALRSSPYTRLLARQIIRLEESSISLLTDYDSTLPGELDIELRHDLIDVVHVGQEIVVTGVLKLRELCDNKEGATSTTAGNDLQVYLRAFNVQDASQVQREFSKFDMEAISMINAEANNFKLLVHSLAPEVHGHEMAKAACLLSLLGGSSGGAINVLLVGDPGIGKSTVLTHCAQTTERGAYINGKRCVQSLKQLGLTFSGRNKRVMDAGALLMANSRGHCIVDGVDKLASKQSLLQQCMQGGQLNLPLPGCFSYFDAQPSIVACANPQRGQYDQSRYLVQNIRITASLLKEFHLVYVLLDTPSRARDISLTEHVRALHAGAKKRARIAARFALKAKQNESVTEETKAANVTNLTEDNKDGILEQKLDYDLDKRLEHKPLKAEELDLLPPILMKKFIAYARQNAKPELSYDAANEIKWYFEDLCQNSEAENEKSQFGLGQLLGLINLSEARARLDFSSVVMPVHVRDVIAVVTESITQTRLGDGQGNAPSSSSKGSQLQNFVKMMQMRSAALGRRIFDYDELKEIGTRAGIMTGIAKLVEIANMGGYLLKKGVDIYEVVPD